MLRIKILQGPEYFIDLDYNLFDTFIGYPCDLLCSKMPSSELQTLPYSLVRIIEYLKSNGLRVKNLFEFDAESEKIPNLITKIDKNEEFDEPVDASLMAGVLHEFLMNLETPIIEGDLVDHAIPMIQVIGFQIVKFNVLEKLKPENAACLKYITDFMKLLVGNSYFNGLSSTHLANTMRASIFHDENIPTEKKKNRVLFLEMLFYG